jgi:tRNA(Arg) A34 adenosine deaminase TadA
MENKIRESLLRKVFDVAKRSKLNGNLAYGCLLVDENNKVILEGENSVLTKSDSLGHAEINLIREASKLYSPEFLNKCTIYTSDEPCPMCSSAIFWGGIGKLTFGLSKARFYQEFGNDIPSIDFNISSRDILKSGGRKVQVNGPFLEDEALLIHK